MKKNKFIGPVELARLSGSNLNTIYRALWLGKMQARRIMGRWSISVSVADRFLADRGAKPAPEQDNEGERP